MGKKLKKAAKSTSGMVPKDEIVEALSSFDAQSTFISATLNMGWQLAVAVLVPVFIGAELDNKFDSSPSYTLAALVIAVFGSVIIVKNNINEVVREQKIAQRKSKGKKRVK